MDNQEKKIIGIVIVTHADYGTALLRAAEFITTEPILDCASVQVDAELEVEETMNRLNDAVTRLDSGNGVLVLTDMFGGTPTNLSLALLKGRDNVEVLTGVNLPMLLRALSNRDKPLQTLAEMAQKSGCDGIIVAGELLKAKPAN